MTFVQFIHNIKASNAWYMIQAKVRQAMWSQEKINKHIGPKIDACSECFNQNACTECGCEAYGMFISDKPCPKGKF